MGEGCLREKNRPPSRGIQSGISTSVEAYPLRVFVGVHDTLRPDAKTVGRPETSRAFIFVIIRTINDWRFFEAKQTPNGLGRLTDWMTVIASEISLISEEGLAEHKTTQDVPNLSSADGLPSRSSLINHDRSRAKA